VDALTLRGDEGRGVAAISFGEVLSNLWSEDFRMGKPCPDVYVGTILTFIVKERTLGSETSQYQEE